MNLANAALRQRGGEGVEIVRVQRRIAAALQIEIPCKVSPRCSPVVSSRVSNR